MKSVVALALSLVAIACPAQEQEVQRALIQRDQQSAEFAARLRGADTSSLEQLHARQLIDAARPLSADPETARQLRPYQRQKLADERTLELPAPAIRSKEPERPDIKPLPLPGGPRHAVDPIPVQDSRN